MSGTTSASTYVVRCQGCGYDLTGLAEEARCPECGSYARATRARASRIVREMRMEDAPREFLTPVMIGFFFCGIGGVGRGIVPCAAGYGLFGALSSGIIAIIVGGLAAAWALGGWLITSPRPAGAKATAGWDRHREWRTLRWTVRGSAALGALSSILLVSYASGGPYWTMAPWAIAEVVFAVSCCWYAALLADWAEHDPLASRFRASAWMIGVGEFTVGMIIAQPWVGVLPLIWLIVVVVALAVIGSGIASIGMLQAANTVRWAIRVARERSEREGRLRAKAAREHAHDRAAQASICVDPPDRVISRQEEERNPEPVGPQGPMPGKDHIVAPGSDAEVYGLEGEDSTPGGR